MKNIFTIIALFGVFQMIGQIPFVENKIVLTNEAKVNSKHLEYSPAFYKNGIVFISTRSKRIAFQIKDQNIGTNVMAIYQSKRDDEGYLETPEPFADELITKMHEGPLTFNSTGNTLYFTRNETKTKAADGKKKLQIYSSTLVGSEWSKINKLPFNQSENNFVHPAISIDNDVLYFSSDMAGGYGGMDLWKVEKSDSTWGVPQNLGAAINTSANEVFPFIHADGTLYFASNGHGGLGGLDIFYSSFNEETWEAPTNLELPFNSNLDDFGLILDLDNKNGYFSSNRKTGAGEDDIYSFYILGDADIVDAKGKKRKNKTAKIALLDEDGNPIQGAKISYVAMDEIVLTKDNHQAVRIQPNGENEFVLNFDMDKVGESFISNGDGRQDISFKEGNYIMTVAKPGYVPQQILITPETNLEDLTVSLQIAADCVPLTGEVLTQAKLIGQSGAEVQIIDVDTKESITVYTDANGVFQHCLPCNKTFTLYADKNGVNTTPILLSTRTISCTSNETLTTKLYINESGLIPTDGLRIRLPNIYFNFDDTALRPDAKKDLEAVEALLKSYPKMKVELASHTDSRGSRQYNIELSNQRSQSVYDYLILKGISGEQMVVKGYGESYIRNRCVDGVICSESEHQFNRRTEVVVLSSEFSESLSSKTKRPNEIFLTKNNGDIIQKPLELTAKTGISNINKSPTKPIINTSQTVEESFEETTQNFWVIAGTFKNLENALTREGTLKNAGFQEVHILNLIDKRMHAVCVQKMSTDFDAKSLVKQLKQEYGINAYVRESK